LGTLPVAALLAAPAVADGPAVRLSAAKPGESPAVEVTGLTSAQRAALKDWKPDAIGWPAVLSVAVAAGDGTAIPGTYALAGDLLRFTPRFPLTPGVRYRATFDPARIPGGGGAPVTAELVVPKPTREPTTVVAQVYPVAEKLPENTLRLYVRFSAPMTRGGVYKHIKLLCGGEEVAHPFLELDEELWSADGKRFTLLFDPGRVKRGLKPREEVGPSLEEGKKYTLVIDRAWEDENGVPLKEPFRKSFSVGPPDDTPIDPDKWTLTPPTAAAPRLAVRLDKPLDHELLHRMVWVVGPGGQKLGGTAEVPDRADSWSFRPAGGKWSPGEYKLVIDTRLEDPCGNRVGRPFEVDVFKPVPKKVEGRTVERRFTVR